MRGLDYANQRVLILAPHADDETIGCGGVIQKYNQHQSPIRIVIASFVMGPYLKYKTDDGAYKSYNGTERLNEVHLALQILGVQDFHFLFIDEQEPIRYHSQLDTIPKIAIINKIEEHIQDFKPTVLFIPSITKHQDHMILHEAGITASRPYFWSGSVIAYETDGELTFTPNLFVPLSQDELNKKNEALNAYKTQIGSDRHPVHTHMQTVKAGYRGQNIYQYYAEAFQVIRLHG